MTRCDAAVEKSNNYTNFVVEMLDTVRGTNGHFLLFPHVLPLRGESAPQRPLSYCQAHVLTISFSRDNVIFYSEIPKFTSDVKSLP